MSFGQFEETQAVASLLQKFHDPRANNAPPLGINVLKAQQTQNGGFPYWMHHQTFAPVHVTNQNQAAALASRGYVTNYIRHAFPRTLYRRNGETIRQLIPGSKETEAVTKYPDSTETKVVNSLEEEDALKAQPKPWNCSEWTTDAAALPALEDGPKEDPRITIARLQAQLAERRDIEGENETGEEPVARRRGRPPIHRE